MKPETLEIRLQKRLRRKRGDVFLRSDFEDLGGYDQIGRVLRQFVAEGKLLRIGQGLYARAVKSPLNDQPMPPRGLSTLTEALTRLGIETAPSRMEQDYNAGRTTQVPTGRVVTVRRRVRRKIGYNGIALSFERAAPAPR